MESQELGILEEMGHYHPCLAVGTGSYLRAYRWRQVVRVTVLSSLSQLTEGRERFKVNLETALGEKPV